MADPPVSSGSRLRLDPGAAQATLSKVGARLLHTALEAESAHGFLAAALPLICKATRAAAAAVYRLDEGRLTLVARAGAADEPPAPILVEAIDREQPLRQGHWLALPLEARHAPAEVLVVSWPAGAGKAAEQLDAPLAELAVLIRQGLQAVESNRERSRRLERLEALLRIAATWNRTQELEPLLNQIAQAATSLLDADRASIFLWDRTSRTLVARPALGVERGELRIADDRGVVGRVIQSGKPQRVDARQQPDRIDRHVDQQLGYQTHTVVCVPLRSRSAELLGAFEVLNKRGGPFSDQDEAALVELAEHAGAALENVQDRLRLLNTQRRIAEQAAGDVCLIGRSPAIEALRSTIGQLAQTDLAVLLLGEHGTGKEVAAKLIHYLGPRRDRPFIAVNCAAIPDTLAESELFGHEKGAFTDARQARAGKFELADGGTLLLDEISELTPSGQAKLLRVLEEKVLVRVGGSTPIPTDVRVLAATNHDLAEMVREGRFREDLYFRLNVVTLELPPLRRRGEDVLLLADYFLNDFARKAGRPKLSLSPGAREKLSEHSWPGNVRELRNLMERLAYLAPGPELDEQQIEFILSPRRPAGTIERVDLPLGEATYRFQVEYIRAAVEQASGSVSEAAELLGLHRSNLYRKMRQLGMKAGD